MKHTPPKSWHSDKHQFAMPRALAIAAGLFIASVAGALICTLVAVLRNTAYTWTAFSWQLSVIGVTAAIFFSLAWRLRHQLSPRMHILLIDAAGVVVWYWFFAPAYQYLTITFDANQVRFNSFAFFWEVTLLASLAFVQTQYEARHIIAYLKTGRTDKPCELYKQLERLPVWVVYRNAAVAMIGFIFGGWLVYYFANLPPAETLKDISIGLVLPFFLCVYYFVAYDTYAGAIKSRLVKQYNLSNIVRSRYRLKLIGTSGTLTLGCLLLTILLYVQSTQQYVDHTLRDSARLEMATLSNIDDAFNGSTFASVIVSPRGKVYTFPKDVSPSNLDLSEASKQYINTHDYGQVTDRNNFEKIVTFRTFAKTKLFTVIYPGDHYETLTSSIKLLGAGSLFVLIVAGMLIYAFSGFLNKTLLQLIKSVANAQETGSYPDAKIHTGDEFEVLSNTFAHFVRKTDISTHKLAEEHARLRASIASLRLGFVMTDAHGTIIAHNAATAKILNSKNLAAAKNLESMLQTLPNKLSILQQWSQSLQHNKATDIARTAYGERFLDIFITPIISTEGTLGTVILIQDVTEAQVLNRSKDEFFSIASHELRTPLTVIRGNTSLMLQLYDKTLSSDPDLKSMVMDMHHASIGLIDIVNDFLDASRLEQGKMEFSDDRIALEEVISTVLRELNSIAENKRLYLRTHLSHTPLPAAHGDEKKVRQILYNLVGNAIKFTDTGGVDIYASSDKQFVTIIVCDTGRGIPQANQKLLFRKFQQASSSILTRDATHGTGLGLYISKLMVDAMGGKIALDKSEENKGTTFSFTLPIDKTNTQDKQKQ